MVAEPADEEDVAEAEVVQEPEDEVAEEAEEAPEDPEAAAD